MILPDGRRAENGFVALAAYDQVANGGDGDGAITVRDAIWRRLRLWNDRNHNGSSEKNELSNIRSSGVVSLSLAWLASNEVDLSGNQFRMIGTYRHRITGSHVARHEERALVDVFFRRLQ
jgi:hypothetical protein